MFNIFKSKKKKVNIEVLKLEYDLIFKFFIFINAIFIAYLWLFNQISYKDLAVWNWGDWLILLTVLIFFALDFWILSKWIQIFIKLRNELEKK